MPKKTYTKPRCPLLQIGALNDVFWKEMKLYDKYKNVFYTVKNKPRYLKKEHKCDYILSFDSETYKGTVKLLADSDKRYILNPTFDECLDFLFYKSHIKNGYRFFYNIDFDVTAILKKWRNIDKIIDLKNGITVNYKKYKLTWLKGKMFKISRDNRMVVFTDLFNFFKIALNKASKQFLKHIEKDKIDGNKLNSSIQYWNDNLNDIINYCVKDCIITNSLAHTLVENLKKANVSLPKYLVSAGSLARQDFRMNCRVNNLYNVPKTIVQIGYDCYYGGKFEIQKKGTFNNLYLYDIVSQYPNFIKDLYDLSYGVWLKVSSLPIKETFGYYKVDLNIPPDIDLSTIPLKLKQSIILTVCGIIKNRWFTWYDLDLMREYITKVHKGYEFNPTVILDESNKDKIDYIKPFYNRILYHFGKKAEYKGNNDILYNIHKLTMNAFYGVNIERHETLLENGKVDYTVGVLFNPIYASQITAYGRWSVIKDIPKRKWKFLCGIHTDSIMSMIRLEKYLKIGKEIGNWNLEAEGKGIIINTGMYQIGTLIKTRGLPKKYIEIKDDNDKVISDWFTFCEINKDLSEKQFEKYHMRKISEALIRNKDTISANIMSIITKTVSANSDHKRHWRYRIADFNDLISRIISSYLWFAKIDNYETCSLDFDCLYQNPLLNDL